MSRRGDKVTITVDFSKDPASDEWIATSLCTPRISVQSVDVRRARRALAAKLAAALGKPVRMIDRISLPSELGATVTRFLEKGEALHEAERSHARNFIALAKALWRAGLLYPQIADLLGVSQHVLKQRLSRYYAGQSELVRL